MKSGDEDKLALGQKPSGLEANAEASAPAANRKSTRSRVVEFATSNHEIPQDAVVEERILYQKAVRSVERWQEQHEAIRRAIENGATVEPGIYRADIVEENWETPLGFTFPITRLVVH